MCIRILFCIVTSRTLPCMSLLIVFEAKVGIKICSSPLLLNTCLFSILQVWNLLKEKIMCSYPDAECAHFKVTVWPKFN